MKKTLQERQDKVLENIKRFFIEKFGDIEHNFTETCWPTSRFDMIQTETKNFIVELKLSTAKVIDIKEEI